MHQSLFPTRIIFYQAMLLNSSYSFMGIASIPKLKRKSNYKEWRNAMEDFCEMNGYWRYMLGQIPQPTPPQAEETTVMTSATQEAFEAKLMKWLTITDLLCGAL